MKKVRLGVTVDPKILRKAREYAKTRGVSISSVVNLALEEYVRA